MELFLLARHEFWHGMIEIRVTLPDGQCGLAKQVFFRTDQTPPFYQNTLGVFGITKLRIG